MPDISISLIANMALIILGFGLLVFFHELGHFVAAKWAGIRTEAFAVGMGPVVLAWRKGIGLRLRSTERDVIRRVENHLTAVGADIRQDAMGEEQQRKVVYDAMDALGIGETEYSLRWLPIGGFVKMLGQDDLNPNSQSRDPRSYMSCPIGKRMVVVSAGVIMNLILAAICFIIAFMVGVKFDAPVIGYVSHGMPAAEAVAINADQLGVTEPGVLPGDLVLQVDGKDARTFADVHIGAAMARGDGPIGLLIDREGVSQPLNFQIKPIRDPRMGWLAIGVGPASSTKLMGDDADGFMRDALERLGLGAYGIEPGMQLISVGGEPVTTIQRAIAIIDEGNGEPVSTTWSTVNKSGQADESSVEAMLEVTPEFQMLLYPEAGEDGSLSYEHGLFGLSPLTRIDGMTADSPNRDILKVGDVVLRIDNIQGPRQSDIRSEVSGNPGAMINLLVLRDGKEVEVDAQVSHSGHLGVYLNYAWDLPIIARPFDLLGQRRGADGSTNPAVQSPIAGLELFPLSRFESVDGQAAPNWREFRQAMRSATQVALERGDTASVPVVFSHAQLDGEPRSVVLQLGEEDVRALHELGWDAPWSSSLFEPLQTTVTAGGNPITAIVMGIEETHKVVVNVYLTIDRLIRGTVPVEELRGPVGIIHLGTQIADRGFMYIVFFLAMISVNLAVLNFLPLPIVDGGLFLFLIYEKLKGRPPSVAFQNLAFIAGLCLIGGLFLLTFYNDIVRLIG